MPEPVQQPTQQPAPIVQQSVQAVIDGVCTSCGTPTDKRFFRESNLWRIAGGLTIVAALIFMSNKEGFENVPMFKFVAYKGLIIFGGLLTALGMPMVVSAIRGFAKR